MELGFREDLSSARRHLGLTALDLCQPGRRKDRAGARCLLAGLKPLVPRLKIIWAGGAYSGKDLANW